MKFTNTEIAPSGKHVLNMRLGAKEVEILRALVYGAVRNTPRMPETMEIHAKLKNLSRGFNSDVVRNAIAEGDTHSEK